MRRNRLASGLVIVDQRDDIASGNVARADDRETCRVEVERDAGDLAGGDGRANRARVQEIRERNVVDIARAAGRFVAPFLAKDVASNGFAHSGL